MGVLGAVVATGGLFADRAVAAVGLEPDGSALDQIVEDLQPVLAELARDTLNGLVVMVCPGPDEYSRAQGTPRPEDGALEARATDFMIASLDGFVPFPDQLGTALAGGLASGLEGTGITLPPAQAALPIGQVGTVDRALTTLLRNDATLPLSAVVAMLLNLVATQVDPAAVHGPFLSPFARLSYAGKCAVFERLEGPDPALVSVLDSKAPEPFTGTLSGMLRFLAGALLEFAAYGSYGEWGVFDPDQKTLSEQPVGWRLTGYQPDGVVQGWDEMIGYYQDRERVSA
nr:hypothetical protein [Pseudonocardia sp. C8]